MAALPHSVSTQRKHFRKTKRLEKLLQSGILSSYVQKVKVAYHYIDLDNKGYMNLKDLSDRGSFVFSYLSIDENLSSSFTFLDTFRRLDFDGSNRITLNEFAIGVIHKLNRLDIAYFEDIWSTAALPPDITSYQDLLKLVESNRKELTALPGNNRMSSLYYLVHRRLSHDVSDLSTAIDTNLIAKVYFAAVRDAMTEVRLQLGIRSSHVAQCWRQTIMATADAENEITEELLSRDEAAYRSVHKNSSRLCWKPSAKRDVLSRRLSFEMTQTSALKHKEMTRSDSVIERRNSVLQMQQLMEDTMANELQSGFDMDALASLSLDSSQLFMLQTAIKSIDSFFSLLSGQTSVSEDANRFQRMDSMNLNKPLARKNSISEQHRTTDGHNQGVSEAVLSVELMDTQEKLRRAQIRLDILELIHYQAEDEMQQQQQAAVDESQLSFDDIMKSVADVKSLVGSSGMEGRALGEFLESNCALVSLDGEDETTNKTFEILDMLQSINTASLELQNQLMPSETSLIASKDDNKNQSELLLRDEIISDLSLQLEQVYREKENMGVFAMEIQIYRDKLHRLEELEKQTALLQQKNAKLEKRNMELEREVKLREAPNGSHHDNAENEQRVVNTEHIKLLQEEINELRIQNERLLKDQQMAMHANKHTDQKLKMALHDNVSLHQQLNKMEEDLNHCKSEIADLNSQIAHERAIAEERQETIQDLHGVQHLTNELRVQLAEARAEASMSLRLREELSRAEVVIAELTERNSIAEVEVLSRQNERDEVESFRDALRDKSRENRELALRIQELERSMTEYQGMRARLQNARDELNDYKIKVEKFAPFLAEAARLRGASRASVRSLQEQDKLIVSLQEKIKHLESDVVRLKQNVRDTDSLEGKLLDAEAENSRLQKVVESDVPKLKSEVEALKEMNRSLEYQYRQISKTGRQSALTAALGSGVDTNSTASSSNSKTPVKQQIAVNHAPLIATPITGAKSPKGL